MGASSTLLRRYAFALALSQVACVFANKVGEEPLQTQIAQHSNVLSRLSAEVAEYELKRRHLKYPGATEAPAPTAEGPSVGRKKTPLIIVAPKPMMKFNNLYEKMVLEAASEGSEANNMLKNMDQSLTDPTEKLKMLRKEEEEAARLQAFYEADEAETEYATKEYSKGLVGRAKSFFHDLMH